MKKYKLLPFSKFNEIHPEYPYIFEIEKNKKKLTYFGSYHCYDPRDKIFSQLKEIYSDFKPEIVFIEGARHINSEKGYKESKEKFQNLSDQEIIKTRGESGYIASLAFKDNIKLYSPEPDEEDEINDLIKNKFVQEEIFLFYLLRQMLHWTKIDTLYNLEDYFEKNLKSFKNNSKWKNFDFSYENFKNIYQQKFNRYFMYDIKNGFEFIENTLDPVPWEDKEKNQTSINRISEQVNIFRDNYIISKIEEVLKIYDRILIVYGSAHAIVQEPPLKEIF